MKSTISLGGELIKGFKDDCAHNGTNHIRMDKIKTLPVMPLHTAYRMRQLWSKAVIVILCGRMDVTQPNLALIATIAY